MKRTEPILHVRTTVSGKWIWELRSADKHVVNVSEGFDTRAECEDDAREHGLQVVPKRARRSQVEMTIVPLRAEPGAWSIYEDDSGLWHWKAPSLEDMESACAFLTRRECVADAQKHGYIPEPGRTDEIETE